MKRYTLLRARLLANSRIFGNLHTEPFVRLTNGAPCRIMAVGWRNPKGYVKLSYRDRQGKSVSVWAHRAAYVALGGKRLRKGQTIDHECCRRDCIEPNHLKLMTRARNTKLAHVRRRAAAKALGCVGGTYGAPSTV